MDCPQSPQRANKARLSFGKSLSKNSLKDSKSSVNSSDSGNTPIPRTKSRSQLFRNKKKSQQSNGVSPEPRSNRNSGASQHLEPFTLNYGSLDATEEPPPSQALRDNELLRSRRISSPPNNLTSADVSLPLRRDSPSLPDTWSRVCCDCAMLFWRLCDTEFCTSFMGLSDLNFCQMFNFVDFIVSKLKNSFVNFFSNNSKCSIYFNCQNYTYVSQKVLPYLSIWVDVKTIFTFDIFQKLLYFSVLCLFRC